MASVCSNQQLRLRKKKKKSIILNVPLTGEEFRTSLRLWKCIPFLTIIKSLLHQSCHVLVFFSHVFILVICLRRSLTCAAVSNSLNYVDECPAPKNQGFQMYKGNVKPSAQKELLSCPPHISDKHSWHFWRIWFLGCTSTGYRLVAVKKWNSRLLILNSFLRTLDFSKNFFHISLWFISLNFRFSLKYLNSVLRISLCRMLN